MILHLIIIIHTIGQMMFNHLVHHINITIRSADGYNDRMHFYTNYDGANYMGAGSPGANVTVSYGAWTHWMLIKNGADTHVVKNGLISQTLTAGERDANNMAYANTQEFHNTQMVGGFILEHQTTQVIILYYSNMEVSEVRFYSRALTEKEIEQTTMQLVADMVTLQLHH